MKICNHYYFSVEGETEKSYLEHLQKLINSEECIPFKVDFDIKVNKSIISRAKTIPAISHTKAIHLCDYESNEEEHVEIFNNVLKELKDVKKIKRNIEYKLGYSNFSFDLWIILHKKQKLGSVMHRNDYLKDINELYGEKFKSMDEYKKKENFNRLLSKITLNDVKTAIKNGNEIRQNNKILSSHNHKIFGKFDYYTDNPDLTINERIEEILKDCKAL